MTSAPDPVDRPLRVLRVYHSAVVAPSRRREAELRARGIDVAVVAPRRWNEGGRDVYLEVLGGEQVLPVRTVGRHPFRFAYEPVGLWRALRRVRPDVLDVHEEPASLAAFEVAVLARLAGVRAPFCLYSAENLAKRYPPPFRWFERFLLRRAAAVHSCNEAVRERLRAKGFSGPVVNLGLGVDVEAFAGDDPVACPAVLDRSNPTTSTTEEDSSDPGPASQHASGRRFEATGGARGQREGEPRCPLHVGYVGRLDERKGIFVLLDAVERVPAARVTFVGAGTSEDRLASEITRRSLGGRAVVEGFVAPEDLPATYRRFDVVVVPSVDTERWSEQFGRVAVEAMAAGVPVVASEAGALPEVLDGAGLLVPQGDAEALAASLEKLVADPALRRRLAEAGRGRARHFSWAAVAERQAVMYQGMLSHVGIWRRDEST